VSVFKCLFLPLALALACTQAEAATYYVTSNGSDSNNGSQASPWHSLTKAIGVAQSGDTVNIGPGTFSVLGNTSNTIGFGLVMSHSGTSGSPITFVGSGQGATILQDRISITGSYNVLSNLTVTGPYIDGSGSHPYTGICNGPGVIVFNGTHNTASGVTITNYVDQGHTDSQGRKNSLLFSSQNDAMVIFNKFTSFNTFTNGNIHDCYDVDYFHVWGHDQTVSYNSLSNLSCDFYASPSSCIGQGPHGNHVDIFQTWGSAGDGAYNINIVGNFMNNSNGGGEIMMAEADSAGKTWGFNYQNNVISNIAGPAFVGVPNCTFYNNVFYNVGYMVLLMSNGGTAWDGSHATIKNNVFIGNPGKDINTTDSSMPGNLVIDHNYFGTASYGAKNSANMGSNPINGGNCNFASVTGLNFVPQSGSVLIAAGLNLSSVFTLDVLKQTRPSSGSWTTGAYQNGGPTAPTTIAVADGVTIPVTPNSTIPINVTTGGVYMLSGSVTAPDTASNSFWVDIGSNPTGDNTRAWDLLITAVPQKQFVAWRGANSTTSIAPSTDQFNPKIWQLAAGPNTLYIVPREAGSGIQSVTFNLATPLSMPAAPADLRIN
jgi:hypothetical protein